MIGTQVNRHLAELNGIAQSWVSWDGKRIPGRCAVVLLHGILQRASPQSHIARHLSRFHPVVMPDLRGRGETPLPAGAACDPATIAEDVALLIEHLELARVVVVGRNHGGVVGYHLAANRPDLVHGLVLGDTSPEIDPDRASRRREFLERIPRAFASEAEAMAFYTDSLGVSEARARHDMPDDMTESDGSLIWRHDLGAVARVEAAAAPRDDWEVLAKVTAPTLVLRGQRRGISDAMVARMREVMPQVEMHTIVGSGPDVFLGPGAEQTRGALDMFLMRLNAE
jgi:pimeloyl-ACP methyl ester carboxylesterase